MSESGEMSRNRVHPSPTKRNTSNVLNTLCMPQSRWKDDMASRRFIINYIKQGDNNPTNAFGEVEMGSSGSRIAKFVRVRNDTRVEILYQLLTKHWKLKTPNLIISVTGGAKNFTLRPKIKEVFRKSLIKASEYSGAWITTGGTHAGVMKHVGKAVKDYAAIRDDQDRVVTIGIATWGAVYGKESLVNKEDRVLGTLTPKHYDPDERDQGRLAVLDFNHSHFILVDDGTEGEYGKEIKLRTDLEEHIAKQTTKDGVDVMIVCVCLQGGPGSLDTVHESIMKEAPVVVVEGSGGFADVLASASTLDRKITEGVLKELLQDFGISEPQDVAKLKEWTKKVRECVEKKDLLSVFKIDPTDTSRDLDIAILEALLKVSQGGVRTSSDKLGLALAWNRSDLARSHILTDDAKIPKREIANFFFKALEAGKADFCKALLEYGVDLKKYCTVAKIEKLYRSVRKDSLLYKKLSKNRKDENFTLLDVGRALLEFLGPSYISVYKQRREGSKKYHAVSKESTDISDRGIHNPDEATFDDPWREVFQWALLADHRRTARTLWEYMWESMPAAIVATKILKTFAAKTNDYDLKLDFLAEAAEYEKLAVGVLAKCFEGGDDKATQLLVRTLKKWGGYTCLHIAIEANDKFFVSRPAVQLFFDTTWMGMLDNGTSTLVVLAAGICPFLIYAIVPFKNDVVSEEDTECKTEEEALYRKDSTAIEMGNLSNRHSEGVVEKSASGFFEINNPEVNARPSRKETPIDKLLMFYDAPIVTFWMNVISFLAYLALFAYIILSNFTENVSIAEYVLLGWTSTFLMEEIREIADKDARFLREKLYLHATDLWNIMDITSLVLFFTGFGLRWDSTLLEAALILYALSFLILSIRVVHIFAVHYILGPKIIMVGKMLKDLLFFLFILVVFLLAYGVASQALLYPNESNFGDIVVGIIYKPYWQIYGELFLEEINYNPNADEYTCSNNASSGLPRCPQSTAVVPILSAVYLLFANVLLLNLLIAMFSYTFDKVQQQGNEIWQFQRYSLITNYYFRPPLAPPFIIFSHIYLFGKFVYDRISDKEAGKYKPFLQSLKMDLKEEVLQDLNKWEHWHAEAYLRDRREEEAGKPENQLRKLNERVDNLASTVENLQDIVKTRKTGHKEIAKLTSLMTDQFAHLKAVIEANSGNSPVQAQIKATTASQQEQAPKVISPKVQKKPKAESKKEPKIEPPKPDLHVKARSSPYPQSDVQRAEVPDEKVLWEVDWPEYTPVSYTADTVKSQPPWADAMLESVEEAYRPKLPYNQQDLTNKVNRASHMGVYEVINGFPRNPKGRTGMCGRGLLGRYGPNHAADPVVTRWKRQINGEIEKLYGKPVLEFVAVKRVDTGEWAIPGGMVDPGEKVSATLKREFGEEAVNIDTASPEEAQKINANVRLLFKSGGLEVYKGYCDDHRNTDNAWIETVAANFHDEEGTVFEHIPLNPGEEAQKACWKVMSEGLLLFASHTTILRKVAEMHNAYF